MASSSGAFDYILELLGGNGAGEFGECGQAQLR